MTITIAPRGNTSALLAALSFTVTTAWGSLFYTFAVLLKPVQASLGVSAQALAGALSLGFVMSGLAAPFAGRWIDRHGGRGLMSGGSLLAGLGLALFGVANSLWEVYLAYAVMGVAMAATFYDPAFTVFTQAARGDAAAARRTITWLTLAGGLASTIFWPFTQWLVTQFGWRNALFVLAAIHVFISAPLNAAFVPSGVPTSNVEKPKASASMPGEARPSLFFSSLFILLAIWFSVKALMLAGVSVQILNILQAQGLTAQLAATVAGFIGIAQVAGRLTELLSGGRLHVMKLALMVSLLMPIGMLFLYFANGNLLLLGVFVVCYGVANGVLTIVRGAIVTELFGTAQYGAIIGQLGLIGQCFKAAGPVIAAWIWNGQGSPDRLILFGLGVGVVGAAVMLAMQHVHGNRARQVSSAGQ